MQTAVGYNVGLEFLLAQQKAFDFTEQHIYELIDSLTLFNDQNRDLAKLNAALTHAKKDKKDADFSEDEEMQETIHRIHEFSPEIFGHVATNQDVEHKYDSKMYVFKLADIETFLAFLDSSVRNQVSQINQTNMYINQNYEDRIQYTETAQKTLEMLIRHIESILGKMRG